MRKGANRSYSWTVIDDHTAIKELDRYAFHDRATGIPVALRAFFGITTLEPGVYANATLCFSGRTFDARIVVDKQQPPRTRLFWEKGIGDVMSRAFPEHSSAYKLGNEAPRDPVPLMILQKTGEDFRYLLSFSNSEQHVV